MSDLELLLKEVGESIEKYGNYTVDVRDLYALIYKAVEKSKDKNNE